MSIAGLWDALVDAICRPPRDTYSTSELPGGKRKRFKVKEEVVERQDLTLINKAGQRLECSHYKPESTKSLESLPIVIYCHCNSGSRRDAEESLHHLLPNGISVFALDFAGSGNSEGEWVTLGAHEVDDLEVAVKHLRTEYPSATIGLWGRSMGAVTALLYTAKDPSIAGIVIDSAFARLTELMGELVEEQKLPIPRYLMRIALSMMRRSVRKRAKFNIDLVAPLEVAPQCHIPVLFGHATEDTFVKLSHSQRLRAAYGGLDKELETFAGDHNSIRPRKFYTSVLVFFHRALLCEDYEVAKASLDSRSVEERGSEVGAPSADRSQPSTALPDQLDAGPSREPAPPGQRQLSPPWDRNLTKTFTEKQLQAIRDNVQADLQIREQSKGVEKDDPKHALLANPCLKSDAVSMTRLGLADAERPANCSVERLGDAGVARDQSSDPWEAVEALGHQSSREYTDNETANSLFSDGSGSLSGTHSRNPSQPSFKRLGAINQASADDLTRRQISASGDLNVKHQGRHIDERDMVFGTLEQIRSMEEDEMVKRAIELSLLEHNKAGGATARDHVQSEDYRPHIPRELYGHDPEDAEEFMLAEALKRSLLEGPGGQPPALEDAGSTQSTPDSARQKRRSRALFWRSKSDASKTSSRNDCQK